MIKRVFDLGLAAFALLLLGPLLAVVALAVRLEDGGPIFYRGRRVGRHKRPLWMLKFRTMVVDAEKVGASSTADDDPRITRVGRFLRALKLDELPQLFNVLGGSMSFVGPRPQVAWAVELYSPQEQRLLDVRPGITDYASLMFRNEGEILRGSTDPDKDYLEKIAPGKIRLGLEYVQHQSLWIDLKIILATALAIPGLDPEWCLSAAGRRIMEQVRQPVRPTREVPRAA
jgi:lipopolysaccharide/colanic/teichoic acid biosynthesis glycosyltransferase